MTERKILYSEPVDYFPKDVREEFFPEMNVDSMRYNEIARNMLSRMLDEHDDENVVFSPYSVFAAINMLADSTAADTRRELTNYLDTSDPDSFDTLGVMNRHLKDAYQFTSANAVIVKNTIKDSINNKYKKMLKAKYSAEFFDSVDIVNDVNKWVSKKTKGMIPKIADDSMSQMIAALINAVTFDAAWMEKYEEDDIYEEKFKNIDKTSSKVQMMHSSEDYYIENELFNGFIKPYKKDEFSFMGLRPKINSKTLIRKIINDLDVTELYDNAELANVEAYIPKFKSEYTKELSGLLKEVGVNQAFEDNADFSPMAKGIPMKIDQICHKALIEVDRHGTKASAVTMEIAIGCAADFNEHKEVYLDQPFIYAVIHNKTHLPIFMGVANKL